MDQFINIFTQQIFLYRVPLYVPREGQHERQGYRFPKKPYLLGRFVQYFLVVYRKVKVKVMPKVLILLLLNHHTQFLLLLFCLLSNQTRHKYNFKRKF